VRSREIVTQLCLECLIHGEKNFGDIVWDGEVEKTEFNTLAQELREQLSVLGVGFAC
jgi:hypothetical protein